MMITQDSSLKKVKRVYPELTKAFKDIQIDQIVSSPYIRAVDTIKGIAETKSMNIRTYDDLRERKVSNVFIDDFQNLYEKPMA